MSSAFKVAIQQIFRDVHLPPAQAPSFPEIVSRLVSLGVNRYHINYITSTATAYAPNPDSGETTHATVEIPKYGTPAKTWSVEKIQTAVRNAQGAAKNKAQGEEVRYGYEDFVRELSGEGGVTDYFACLEGKRVVYFGGNGDVHTEWFPGAKPAGTE